MGPGSFSCYGDDQAMGYLIFSGGEVGNLQSTEYFTAWMFSLDGMAGRTGAFVGHQLLV